MLRLDETEELATEIAEDDAGEVVSVMPASWEDDADEVEARVEAADAMEESADERADVGSTSELLAAEFSDPWLDRDCRDVPLDVEAELVEAVGPESRVGVADEDEQPTRTRRSVLDKADRIIDEAYSPEAKRETIVTCCRRLQVSACTPAPCLLL